MSETFVAKAPRTALERIISAVSVQTGDLEVSAPATAQGLGAADYAAMVAGLKDAVAKELVWVATDDADAIRRVVEELDLWGWVQLRKHRNARVSPQQHKQLVYAALHDYQQGSPGYTLASLAEYLGADPADVRRLLPHLSEIASRLLNCEQALIQHLRRQAANG